MSLGPVVSAAHLAETGMPALSELEFAMTTGHHAFQRWMVHCMAASGAPGMSPMEVQVLHLTRHRDRPKTLAQICLMLNVEDTHLVSYAVRKLRARDLVGEGRVGKEKTIAATPAGAALCDRYAAVRKELLLEAMGHLGCDEADISRLAALLRALSGSYDQASRSAAMV